MRQRTRPSLLRAVIHRLFGAEPLPEPNHNYYNLDHMKEILIFSNRNTKVSFAEMRLKMSATWHPLFLPECELKTHKMRAALSERILMLSINGVTVCHRYLLFIFFFRQNAQSGDVAYNRLLRDGGIRHRKSMECTGRWKVHQSLSHVLCYVLRCRRYGTFQSIL